MVRSKRTGTETRPFNECRSVLGPLFSRLLELDDAPPDQPVRGGHGGSGGREFWQPSPDTEDVRQHLLDIVRAPEGHTDGYPFFSPPPHVGAVEQLVEFGDERVVEALEDLAQRNEVKEARADLLELIKTVRKRLTL